MLITSTYFPLLYKARRLLALIALLLMPSGISVAAVKGSCSDCHTMHNSQDNTVLTVGTNTEALLRQDCVGCHTGENDGSNTTPYVHNTMNLSDNGAEYGYSGIEAHTLAGGTFKYVKSNDRMGHNVIGITDPDLTLFIPPGYAGGGLPAADGTTPGTNGNWNNAQITCAGTTGCHGSHDTDNNVNSIRGAHHQGSSGAVVPNSDTSPAAGYRMLVGISGFEASNWEYKPSDTEHNQYKGINSPGQTSDPSTISYMCAECHGSFHQSNGNSSPWLRHPTDFAIGSTDSASEYWDYGGAGNNYLPATPLASSDINNVISTINFTTNDSIVTCISCHRAHGSPYYKSMRWGYIESNDGGLCKNCHTSKD